MPDAITSYIDLDQYVDEARNDAVFAFEFLRETGSLTQSWIFNVVHKIPDHDKVLFVNFPSPWQKVRESRIKIANASEQKDLVIVQEPRLKADTFIHAHTPYLASWSLAQKPFPILYVAAQRHFLSREIPNHLERKRSVTEIIREQLDTHPDWAPPPGILESNGGANFWGKGIVDTARLVLLIEESARLQSLAEQVGGAQVYTPGALEVQWRRTGLWERSQAYAK